MQALAIRGDRVIAIGDSAQIIALAGSMTKRIDLGGRTVIPGFNDAHNHLSIHPAGWIQLQFQGPDPSWSEVKAAILKAPKGVGLMAEIGVNVFYDTNVNRDSLDQVAPDRPVMLSTLTYHAAILNSAALKVAGVREDQADPMGGRYERSPGGRLTGVLREYAARSAVCICSGKAFTEFVICVRKPQSSDSHRNHDIPRIGGFAGLLHTCPQGNESRSHGYTAM